MARTGYDGRSAAAVTVGMVVDIILKKDQKTGKLTRGVVSELLTRSAFHPHGIKVRLTNGLVGRVGNIIGDEPGKGVSENGTKKKPIFEGSNP